MDVHSRLKYRALMSQEVSFAATWMIEVASSCTGMVNVRRLSVLLQRPSVASSQHILQTNLPMIQRYAYLALAALSAAALSAQPTLTDDNAVPTAGSVFPISAGTYEFPGAAGADQLFGHWMLLPTGNRDISYVSPSLSNTASTIPGTTILSTDGGSDTLFWGLTTNGMEILADLSGLGLVVYTDPVLELKLPCTFGTSWTDAVSAAYTVSGFQVQRTGTVVGLGDAFGTLELPELVLQNVLRVKVRKVLLDNSPVLNVRRASETYYFFTEGVPHPALRLQLDSVTLGTGNPAVTREAQWMYGNGNVSVQSIDPDLIGFSAYPNPASGAVSLSFGNAEHGARRVELMDATGRVVRQQPLALQNSTELPAAFNTAGLAPGVYHIRLVGENSVLGTQRLVVQ